jgi:polyisoprenoid-binding protein YceI
MKKQSIIVAFLMLVNVFSVTSQKMLILKSSNISFFSKTPLRDIEAENTASSSLINLDSRDIVIKIPVKSFQFPNKLMQEHFNENYLETDKFPSASFKGKINEILDVKKEGKYNVSATGKITIHGVERPQNFKGTATIKDGKLTIDTIFEVALVDYKIDIPKIVFEEIAEKIKVTCKMSYEEKK